MMIHLFNKFNGIFQRLKTLVYYKPQFQAIGWGTVVRKPLLIINPQFMTLGRGVLIREGARLEALKSSPERSPSLMIGDYTNIEQNVHIICHSRIHVGANVSITGNCSIVDVTHPYENIDDPKKIGSRILNEDSYVEIGDDCFIGMGTIILPNVKIGRHCMIGANSVVNRDVPDYCVAAGAPARVVRRYDPEQQKWIKL